MKNVNGLDVCDFCMKVIPYSTARMNGYKGTFICEECILHANARLPSWKSIKDRVEKLCQLKP